MIFKKITAVFSFIALVAFANAQTSGKIVYPKTEKGDYVQNYFGTVVPDPYRWMEDDNSDQTKGWVISENKVTNEYLAKIPYRETLRNHITQLYNYERYSTPYRQGAYYFFTKNNGLQNQSVIYYQKGIDGTPGIFIDPNAMNAQGTSAVSILGFSHDRKLVAYSVSEAGSDWSTVYVMDVATHTQMTDTLKWVKFSGAAWFGNGFFYSRYDAPKKGDELSAANKFQKVYYHKIGEAQKADKLIYEDKDHPMRYFGAQTTDDEKYLLINISEGTDGSEIWYEDLKNRESGFKKLVEGFKYNYTVVDDEADNFILFTNYDAQNYRIVSIDPKNPAPANWKNLVAEKDQLLQNVTAAGGKLFCTYLKDAASRVVQFDRNGKGEHEIELPGIGTVAGFDGEKDDKQVFYSFVSFITPATIYKYDIASGASTAYQKPKLNFNPDDFKVEQVFYHSKDGTSVPMFIVHRKDMKPDATNPTLLYGYGGFNIPITPNYNPSRMVLLMNGGIYAVANIRGGNEYGEKWHEAGMLLKKQNVFDDFIAAAQFLIDQRYTSKDKLAIIGRSNGGLLVGACETQRPDLFKVCFPGVGVMDMLRYHKFTVGWGWAVEYGTSDDSTNFKNLYSYSPINNLKPGVHYPATLITTADHDDRVVPAHSFKYAATIQADQGGDAPVLIRIDVNAGHGGGRPLSKTIDEDTDIYAFMFWNMGMTNVR